RLVVRRQIRKLRRVFGEDLDEKALLDARSEKIRSPQNEIVPAATGALDRLQLAWNLRRRRLREVELGNEVRVLLRVKLERILRQCEIPGGIHDVDRHGTLRHRRHLPECRGGDANGK